jgi:uncharacterized protein YyaL (SSP411 family)
MSDEAVGSKLNALSRSASAYLRSAQHQPVEWNEWGAEAFAKAKAEDKPVLLDIGAVWCHWCHVMDRESYENGATAEIINAKFVAVKVDRDERPDVDARYQAAVAAISGQGGWPLTAFLTPDGKPYFGGGYFPPDERYGRPSFARVLLTMADAYAHGREDVEETAASVMAAVEHNESFSGHAGEPGRELLEKIIAASVAQFDERHGGFGSQPKFPHAGALELLIDAAGRGGGFSSIGSPPIPQRARDGWATRASEVDLESRAAEVDLESRAAEVVRVTLERMAAGGIYDQLGGGFHRYSVDETWVVPHFEKMAYDNSELLKVYAHAAVSFEGAQGAEFARVAKDILRWMDEWLSDRELGGFYASQDADDSLEDDGDYFTWTVAEAKEVLTAEEFEVAVAYFDLRAVGDMHHNPEKNVLRVASSRSVTPAVNDSAVHGWATLLASVKAKMYAARLLRKTPYVDKTVYTGWNGMCVSAYLQAGRALGLAGPVAFGLKTLDRVLEEAFDPEIGLARVVAYGEGVGTARIPGVLEDYGFVANAALDAWEATGKFKYYVGAKALADRMLERFYDAAGGGFFDTEFDEEAIGALSTRRKPLQDSPTPSGNAVAATVLLRLHALTGNAVYEARALETLETFAGVVEHFGLYAASYGLALRRAVEGPVQVCVIGEDGLADEFEAAALRGFAMNKSVVRLRSLVALPPALAETLVHLPESAGSVAVLCRGMSCLPPVGTVEELMAALGN